MTSQTGVALTADLESVLGGLQTDLTSGGEEEEDTNTNYDSNIDATDAAAIRRQLDGLEGMYSEVLKLLGLRKYGRTTNHTGEEAASLSRLAII